MPLKPIDKVFEALCEYKCPEHLYHYTTFEGLKGIVESKSLRATHRSYLNDSEDLSYGLSACITCVRRWAESRNGHEKKLADEIVSRLTKEADNKPSSPFAFSASFTEESDSAVPWQVYGQHGRGIAVSFDFEGLRKSLREADCFDPANGEITAPHFVLGKVEYKQTIQGEQVIKLLDTAAECWPDALAYYEERVIERTAYYVSHYLGLLTLRTFKHPGYDHEREWKAIPHIGGVEFIEFHATKYALRPYLKMAFAPSCIRSVVVGSAVPFENAKQALQLFFEKQGLSHVDIVRSELPLTYCAD